MDFADVTNDPFSGKCSVRMRSLSLNAASPALRVGESVICRRNGSLKHGSTQRFHISETETFRSANGRQTGQFLPGEHFASCAESRGPYTAHYAIQLFEQVGATRIEQYSEMEAGVFTRSGSWILRRTRDWTTSADSLRIVPDSGQDVCYSQESRAEIARGLGDPEMRATVPLQAFGACSSWCWLSDAFEKRS